MEVFVLPLFSFQEDNQRIIQTNQFKLKSGGLESDWG